MSFPPFGTACRAQRKALHSLYRCLKQVINHSAALRVRCRLDIVLYRIKPDRPPVHGCQGLADFLLGHPGSLGHLLPALALILASIAQGDLLYGSASNTIAALAKSASATRYLSNTGSSNAPAWAQIDALLHRPYGYSLKK